MKTSAKPLDPTANVRGVGTKGLEERYARHLAAVLRPIVESRFGGNATAAARAMNVAQSHLAQILAAKGRGAGVNVLIRLRAFTGLTLDELLGLPALRGATPETELERRIAARVLAELAARDSDPPPPPEKPSDGGPRGKRRS